MHDELRHRAARQTHRPEVRHDVGHRDDRVEHGDVDVLTLAGAVALAERGEHADGREQRGTDVAEGADRRDQRRSVVGSLQLVDARHRLHDRSERRPAAVRRLDRVAEPRNGHVDDRGVHRGDVLVRQTELRHRPGLGVLGDDVEARRQVEHELAPAR